MQKALRLFRIADDYVGSGRAGELVRQYTTSTYPIGPQQLPMAIYERGRESATCSIRREGEIACIVAAD